MFTFSKTYIHETRACAYRGESGMGYAFSYLDDGSILYVPLDEADSVKVAVPKATPKTSTPIV